MLSGALLTSEGERGVLSKSKESVLDLGKKYHNYIHLWITFSLKMLYYKGILENFQKCFPADPFFMCSRLIVYQSALIFRNLSRHETFLVQQLSIWLFEKNEQLLFIWFTYYTKKKQRPRNFLQKGYSAKCLVWQSHFLVRKFQVSGFQIYLKSTPSPLFSESFSEWLQTTYMTYKIKEEGNKQTHEEPISY